MFDGLVKRKSFIIDKLSSCSVKISVPVNWKDNTKTSATLRLANKNLLELKIILVKTCNIPGN